ncbi:MAG: BatD family protein [Pontibacterium sp.]
MQKLLLLVCLISLPLQAAVNARVNVQTLTLGETLQLTLEADQKFKQNPDLSTLSQSFRIIGSKQMSISSYSNGERHFSTRWQIMLRPLKYGALSIPSISVGAEKSLPISLNVLANNRAMPGILSESLLLEAELDTNEIYIHSQAILTTRFHHRHPLPDGAVLSKPMTADAIIKPLGEPRQYQTQLRGLPYQVTEQRYGIYPQQTGLIRLEPLSYNDGKPGSIDQQLQKAPLELAVLPRAQQRPPGFWLPATEVSLEDSLQQRSSAPLGKEVKRVLTLEAAGILAENLPPLSPLNNELADIRLDNVILEEHFTDTGLISRRIEELTLTPTERGEITLPEIRVGWWDVRLDKSQSQALPPRLINVSDDRTGAGTAAASVNKASGTTENTTLTEQNERAEPLASRDKVSLLIWLLTALAVISSLGWLYTYNRMRHPLKIQADPAPWPLTGPKEEISPHVIAEINAYQELARACGDNDCKASQYLLTEWAQYFWPQQHIYRTDDIAHAAGSQTFELLLMDMEHHLNYREEHLWQGDLLLEAVSRLRDHPYSQDQSAENRAVSSP